jgi:membrane protein DedA with SNARE-associated domain
LVGAVLLYTIGLQVRFERLVPMIKRSDLATANTWFERYGYWGVVLGRLVPLVRSIISIPAGIARMKFNHFLLYTALGTLFWNALLVLGGASLGRAWPNLLQFMKVYTGIGVVIIGAVGIAYIGWRRVKRLA